MPRHACIIIALVSLAALQVAVGHSRSDHGILNATLGVIRLDVDSSMEQVSDFELAPGESFVFDGVFLNLAGHLRSGKILSFGPAQLQALHGGTLPKEGYWVVDSHGVHSGSVNEYLKASDRVTHKIDLTNRWS
jgi:hypothetical protein